MKRLPARKHYFLSIAVSLALSIASSAQTFTTILTFSGSEGLAPYAPLTQGLDGNLYGVTKSGGAYNSGTIFRITLSGQLTTIYNFCSQTGCPDGSFPDTALALASDGSFYGTTFYGGANNAKGCFLGCGTVFRITPAGVLTTLHSFCAVSQCADGYFPGTPLFQATDGNFYGTTIDGGTDEVSGTIFRISSAGSFATVYAFCSASSCSPQLGFPAGLVQATDGNFYGTADCCGNGALFKMTPSGMVSIVYNFCNTCGSGPTGLIQGADGNFYGMTSAGGSGDSGTIFRVTPSGQHSTIRSFAACTRSSCPDGFNPITPLIQTTGSHFYGSTSEGDPVCYYYCGSVFSYALQGTLTILQTFDLSNGSGPLVGLVQATNGEVYGTAEGSDSGTGGTIFTITTGLPAFVRSLPTSGSVGNSVEIIGTGLTGATRVSFNGVNATFTIMSSSEIVATVPSGASTGTILVKTPSGTLHSNVKFRVIP